MADPILPNASAVLTPAIDAIVGLRPESLAFFNSLGRWNDLPTIWRAQVLLNLVRLGDEVASARLRLASGAALRQLAASEFSTVLPPDPQAAYATISLSRPDPAPSWAANTSYALGATVQPSPTNGFAYQAIAQGTSGSSPPAFPTSLGATVSEPSGLTWKCVAVPVAPQGVVRKGTLFVKKADPNAQPLPVAAATYETTATVFVAAGQLSVDSIPAVAQSPGTAGNVPVFSNVASGNYIQPAQPLFDANLSVSSSFAAGGSSGLPDPVLRAAARAYAIGQFGPTDGALLAGALQQQSVRRFAAFPASALVPYAQVFLSDESWAESSYWTGQVAQFFSDNWRGFGCRARFGSVVNWQAAIAPAIVLKSTDDLNFTDEIDANVRAAARAYFDDRPDWYGWKSGALAALLSVADDRILYCSGVSITDAATGAAIADQSSAAPTSWSPTLTHLYLTDDNVQASYSPPN